MTVLVVGKHHLLGGFSGCHTVRASPAVLTAPPYLCESVTGSRHARMQRIAEPELMLDPQQVRAYADANFEEPHSAFIELLRARLGPLPAHGVALDLGCGPGDISLRFVRAFPGWQLHALDGSPAMIAAAQDAAAHAGLHDRVCFSEAQLPKGTPPLRAYDMIFSNSLLHHLRDPAVLWMSARRWAAPAAKLFVMDLLRPADVGTARDLVARYAGNEPKVLRTDFYNSLLAAYCPGEVREQVSAASLGHLSIEVVSDRHLIVWGRVRSGSEM